jgi:phage gpG-like protein
MPVEFTLEAIGDVQIKRDFLRFGERAEHAEELWHVIMKDLMLIERVQFLTEGAHGSGGWAKLKDKTLAAKRAQGLEPWILRATETLFKSLTEEGATGQIHEVTRDGLHFGTDVKQAIFHQRGAPGANIPRRPIVQLREDERRGIAKSVQRFILTGEAVSIVS